MPQKKEQSLEKKLQEAQKIQNKKKSSSKTDNKREKKIEQLQNENQELSETCKRAQFDYINLKSDMDIYQRRIDEKEANMQVDILIDTIKKILPFVEELRKSLENIPEDQKNNSLAKGLQLTYDKFIKKLEELHIVPISAIGETPNSEYHEPVSMVPTDDKKLKGKIIQEFERGFIYKKDGIKKIVNTAKVVI
ncbi:MAG: nucleotide exchange factor GrpE [bacterium]|nr:nucleotide exchange factor GrpE [bacterium]